jgi:hypothetical protein
MVLTVLPAPKDLRVRMVLTVFPELTEPRVPTEMALLAAAIMLRPA